MTGVNMPGLVYAVSIKSAEETDQEAPDWLGIVAADTLEQLSVLIGTILDTLNIEHGEISYNYSQVRGDQIKLRFYIDNPKVLVFAGWEWAK